MKRSHESTPKLERKTLEKNRRICMRNLSKELGSYIPTQYHSRVELSLPGRLEQAVDYINETEDRIREFKNRKINLAMGIGRIDRDVSCENAITTNSKLPMVEVSDSGSTLNVVLISSLNKNVMLSDVITVLEEEGAEVLSASQYFGADRCLHVLHSQVKSSRVGYGSENINKRLKELVH